MPQVDVGSKRADVIYTTTDEEENINLAEVIGDKSIAFSKPSLLRRLSDTA